MASVEQLLDEVYEAAVSNEMTYYGEPRPCLQLCKPS